MQPLRVKTTIDATNWVKGLITEASPLNFPEGASVDEENFVLNRDGTRNRRYGIGWVEGTMIDVSASEVSVVGGAGTLLEQKGWKIDGGFGTVTATLFTSSVYLWQNAGEDPNRNIFVYQFGRTLHFWPANQKTPFNSGYFGQPFLSLSTTTNIQFSYASIQGNLLVSCGNQDLIVVKPVFGNSFNINTEYFSNTYTISTVRLKVRDFWGVDDGFATDERTSTLTDLHAYNLYNQGWVPEFFCSSDPDNPTTMNNGTVEDPVERTKLSLGVYPSNADILYTALTMLTNGRKAYYPHALKNVVSGNTPAASGHYIIDLFDRSQGRKDTYDDDVAAGWTARRNYKTSIPTDQSTGYIKTITAYAGRVFYACSAGEIGGDSKSPHIGTFVLFSKLADSINDLGKCYQEADPTSEDISDLIDTDGGYIQIPDAINITALVPFKSDLLVFADNGVWAISGGDRGFTATEYQTKFLSNNGLLAKDSIVVTPNAVMYWGRNGIFALEYGQAGIQFQSLTEYSIQKLYNSIPNESKKYVVGCFDETSYRCRWLYQYPFNAVVPQKYTNELILDLSMPAWSKFKFYDVVNLSATATPRVHGYLKTPTSRLTAINSDYRYLGLGEASEFRWVVISLNNLNNTDFEDWSVNDALAYLITGYTL